MSGTKIGGQKAAYQNKLRHGLDFYARIGARGGRNGHTGGFASNPELARIAGRKGGKKSRRTGVKNGQGKNFAERMDALTPEQRQMIIDKTNEDIRKIIEGLDSSSYKEYLPKKLPKKIYDDERVNYQSY